MARTRSIKIPKSAIPAPDVYETVENSYCNSFPHRHKAQQVLNHPHVPVAHPQRAHPEGPACRVRCPTPDYPFPLTRPRQACPSDSFAFGGTQSDGPACQVRFRMNPPGRTRLSGPPPTLDYPSLSPGHDKRAAPTFDYPSPSPPPIAPRKTTRDPLTPPGPLPQRPPHGTLKYFCCGKTGTQISGQPRSTSSGVFSAWKVVITDNSCEYYWIFRRAAVSRLPTWCTDLTQTRLTHHDHASLRFILNRRAPQRD